MRCGERERKRERAATNDLGWVAKEGVRSFNQKQKQPAEWEREYANTLLENSKFQNIFFKNSIIIKLKSQ